MNGDEQRFQSLLQRQAQAGEALRAEQAKRRPPTLLPPPNADSGTEQILHLYLYVRRPDIPAQSYSSQSRNIPLNNNQGYLTLDGINIELESLNLNIQTDNLSFNIGVPKPETPPVSSPGVREEPSGGLPAFGLRESSVGTKRNLRLMQGGRPPFPETNSQLREKNPNGPSGRG